MREAQLTSLGRIALKARLVRIAALAAASVLVVPAAAPASESGWAWDSVSKIAEGSGTAAIYPGEFEGDFHVASQTQAQGDTGGGLMGRLKQAVSMGQNMTELMQNGIAQHHYVAGSKERTDEIAFQTATIVDCAARTITSLDLAKKTYHVVSMDAPAGPSSSGGGASPAKDDGTKVAIAVANTGMGPMQIAGEPTHGFSSHVTVTETRPSGESKTQTADILTYYATFPNPSPECARFGGAVLNQAASEGGGQGLALMARASRLMRELSTAGADQRFNITQSGPYMPLDHFSMYDAVSITSNAGHNVNFVTERGHVRTIDPADPVFSVPADFTKVP